MASQGKSMTLGTRQPTPCTHNDYQSISKTSTQASAIPPLYSFEHADDYVYDVKWSPTHPALFGTVDGTGQFDLWNLNADTEEPFVSTQVGSGKALNKLAWDKEGKKTAIGSSDGHVYVYDIGEVSCWKCELDDGHLTCVFFLFQGGNSQAGWLESVAKEHFWNDCKSRKSQWRQIAFIYV